MANHGTLAAKAFRVWRQQGVQPLLRKIGRRLAAGERAVPEPPAQDLRVVLDRLPRQWRVGKGNVLHLTGSCYHPAARIAALEVVANGTAVPVPVRAMTRADVFREDCPESDPLGHSLHSGFSVLVPVPACPDRASLHLALRARLRDGSVCLKALGDIDLLPAADAAPNGPGKAPAVAVCMATYNPSPELFARQVESIRKQTHRDWVCVISDDCSRPRLFEEIVRVVGNDRRFVLHQNNERLGFYHNFEKCLALVPAGVQFVALSDHDDWWQPGKLETLLAEFDAETTLVYSDMNIVDANGRRIANTYWTTRLNNHTDLGALFLANTVTGAASLFRRELLDYLLPFPDKIGTPFHDHWIACAALTLGKVKYIDRPLYDYVQHGGNVIGHFVPPRAGLPAALLGLLKALTPFGAKARLKAHFAHAKAIYFNDLLRIQHLAQILRLRAAGRTTRPKRKLLTRLARLDSSWRTAAWLAGRGLLHARRKTVTMGAENCVLRGIAWRRAMGALARLRLGQWAARPPVGLLPQVQAVEAPPCRPAEGVLEGLERVEAIEQKVAPLALRVDPAAPRRVNLLLPTIDFNYVFGGYITKFHLARLLAEEGYRVRIVTVDHCDFQPARWRQQLQAYPGLERLLDAVEVCPAFPRSKEVECSPADAFIATTWWTAHVAHHAARALGRGRFTYLIQEFEPFTFPMGSYAALADQSYAFPHDGIFSTEFLRDYFRRNGLGVYAAGAAEGDRASVAFQNTITAVGRVDVADIAGRSPKKLLFYARPEAHAARNMFELGVAALTRATQAGWFARGWELFGIGTVGAARRVPLGGGAAMRLLPRQTQETYREVLRAHDLGLALMYTPHPSLVPIEMASAGMLTVTNTCANKTGPLLRAISPNLIAAPPTVEGVLAGLRQALDGSEDYEARARGARVNWAMTWDHAFNKEVLGRINGFLETGRDGREARAA